MKRILTVILLCLISVPIARAGDCGPQSDRTPVHELSLGVGDQLFENLVWQNPQFIVDNMAMTGAVCTGKDTATRSIGSLIITTICQNALLWA